MITQRRMIVPIFEYRLEVLIYDNWEEVKHRFDDGPAPKGICFHKYGASIVAIKYGEYDTIVHEAEHIKNAIWSYIGYSPQSNNDEVDAYLLKYIFTKIKDVYLKHDGVTK